MIREMRQSIQNEARSVMMPDGTESHALTVAQTEQLAIRHGVLTRTIEIAALEDGILPLRYARNFSTFSLEDQIRLLTSRITVVGLGGLGGTLVEILGRAGVGNMVLVDGDIFEDHNLNRQLLSSHAALGTAKARSARDRLRAINASVDAIIYEMPFTPANGPHLVDNSQVVVDCLDNIVTRFDLQAVARQARLPMVSAAVAGVSGHITTIYPQDAGLAMIYGPPDALKSPRGAETRLGCLPQGVSTIAAIESAEVIKVLLGQTENTLRNRLLLVDLSGNSYEMVNLV